MQSTVAGADLVAGARAGDELETVGPSAGLRWIIRGAVK